MKRVVTRTQLGTELLACPPGFRIAQNTVANPGFYWRPDDRLSWSPMHVFATPEAAVTDLRRHLAEAARWDRDDDDC